ncbi:hypothetical protein CPB84DRAFT_283255 [Gymnopilus junonius]|uniref:Uncharacterized protein n=1 Tax=Gymnopilus junonius TaxID=109634 RepID=A0A9P5NBE5_GYMJU|nr:hypothetical protein CPB84DRAFT_283255 [Gymnopilus junonius]
MPRAGLQRKETFSDIVVRIFEFAYFLSYFSPARIFPQVHIVSTRMSIPSLFHPLGHPNVNVTDMSPTFLDIPDSVTFPLSQNNVQTVLDHPSGDLPDALFSDRSCFNFLPGPVTDPDQQLAAFETLIRRNESDQLSLRFNSTIHQHMDNLTNHRLHDFLYGAGSIDILNDIILPNVRRLRHLDCVLSNEDHSRLLLHLPETVRQSLEDVDITFVNIWGRPTSTFAVHSRYTFVLRPVDSHQRSHSATCQIKFGLPPLCLHLPWSLMKRIDMGTTIILPDTFLEIMTQASESLTEGSFYVVFPTGSSTLFQHQPPAPINMCSLTKLRLRLVDTNNHPSFLLFFRLPVITALGVEWADRIFPFEWDETFYKQWLSDSSDTLQRLILTDLPIYTTLIHSRPDRLHHDRNKLEDLLSALPNLKSLNLPPGIQIPNPTRANIANGLLLPHLTFLGLATEDDQEEIFNMLHFRNNISSGCTPITSLDLMMPWAPPIVQSELREEVEMLGLTKGYRVRFLRLCRICERYCCFGG